MARPPKITPRAAPTAVSLYPHQRAAFTSWGGSAWLQGLIDARIMDGVRAVYRTAYAQQSTVDGSWKIIERDGMGSALGRGASAGEAWYDATIPKTRQQAQDMKNRAATRMLEKMADVLTSKEQVLAKHPNAIACKGPAGWQIFEGTGGDALSIYCTLPAEAWAAAARTIRIRQERKDKRKAPSARERVLKVYPLTHIDKNPGDCETPYYVIAGNCGFHEALGKGKTPVAAWKAAAEVIDATTIPKARRRA